jgi:hypothetical protein
MWRSFVRDRSIRARAPLFAVFLGRGFNAPRFGTVGTYLHHLRRAVTNRDNAPKIP